MCLITRIEIHILTIDPFRRIVRTIVELFSRRYESRLLHLRGTDVYRIDDRIQRS